MLEMNEERIKQILGYHDSRLEEIHNRFFAIHKELIDTDSLIESVSIKKIEFDRQGSIKGGVKKDLTEVMLRHQQLAKERERDLRVEMYQLVSEEEAINRIWVCFRALRGKEYHFVEQLYVKEIPYKVAEIESGVSHKTFEMYRRSGMKKILEMYQSEFSTIEIIGRSNQLPEKSRKKEQNVEEQYTQLELNI